MCEDGVCECTVWVCVCNHFHLCADTTPCVEANGCRLATPFLYVSLPFVLLPSRHISAAFTAPHPSLFLFLCPILSFYYLHHFDTPHHHHRCGLHEELIFIFHFPFFQNPAQLTALLLPSPPLRPLLPFIPLALPYSCCFGLVKWLLSDPVILFLCHPQSCTALSACCLFCLLLAVSFPCTCTQTTLMSLTGACQGVFVGRTVSSLRFLFFQVQQSATVLAYHSHLLTKKQNKKRFVVLNRTRSLTRVNSRRLPSLEFTLLFNYSSIPLWVLSYNQHYFFSLFFLSNFDSCRSGHPRWLRQTDTKRRFDMMMVRVIVLFQSFGEKGAPVCAQSPAAIAQAKICIEAEMGEVLYNNLTDSRQISYVVSASEETVPLSFQFQWHGTWVACNDCKCIGVNERVVEMCVLDCMTFKCFEGILFLFKILCKTLGFDEACSQKEHF